jgi:hypothetical protein
LGAYQMLKLLLLKKKCWNFWNTWYGCLDEEVRRGLLYTSSNDSIVEQICRGMHQGNWFLYHYHTIFSVLSHSDYWHLCYSPVRIVSSFCFSIHSFYNRVQNKHVSYELWLRMNLVSYQWNMLHWSYGSKVLTTVQLWAPTCSMILAIKLGLYNCILVFRPCTNSSPLDPEIQLVVPCLLLHLNHVQDCIDFPMLCPAEFPSLSLGYPIYFQTGLHDDCAWCFAVSIREEYEFDRIQQSVTRNNLQLLTLMLHMQNDTGHIMYTTRWNSSHVLFTNSCQRSLPSSNTYFWMVQKTFQLFSLISDINMDQENFLDDLTKDTRNRDLIHCISGCWTIG